MGATTVCCGKFSHRLLDMGFFCVLGTHEFGAGETEFVKRGVVYTYDVNNGVFVMYDEEGRPWILPSGLMSIAWKKGNIREEFKEFPMIQRVLKQGAHVPHSNDGGRFVRGVLPTL